MVEVELSAVLPTMKIKTILKQRKDCVNTSITKSGFTPNIASDRLRKSVDGDAFSTSMESIEKDYVIVNAYFASMDAFSFYLETSVQDKSTTRVSICPSGKSDKDIAVEIQTMELADSSVGAAQSHGSDLLVTSSASSIIREVQGLTILHPLTTLHLLYQYVQALAELSQEKYNAGLLLESFSVELVVLAIWKKALQICSSWLASAAEGELPENCDSTKEWVTGFGIASISSLALSGFNDGIGWSYYAFLAAASGQFVRMKNLLRLLAGLKVSVKTNPTLVRGTVVLDIHPDDISQKETETELLLDDDTLAKAANYISMVENAGKLGGVLHSVVNVRPKEMAKPMSQNVKPKFRCFITKIT
ncbi:serine/threonine-protein kinase ATG1a isoform X1 [Fagus crenata]